MGWFRQMFRKKKELKEDFTTEITPFKPFKKRKFCSACGGEITIKYTKKAGMLFHRACWNEQKRG